MDRRIKSKTCMFILLALLLQLARGQNEGYFWHVTDMHLDPTYDTASAAGSCGVAPDGQDSWGQFGDYLCDAPWMLIRSSVEAMRDIRPDVDFLIWTGDDTPHIYDDDLLNKEAVFKIISNLTDLLVEVFPDKTVYSALGNHDWSPKSALPPGPDPFYDRIADKWSDWLRQSQADQSFRQGGYYSLEIPGTNLQAIVLNTNLYYTSNNVVEDTGDPSGQLQWLDAQLSEVQSQGKQALIVTHIPAGMFEKHRSKYWMYPEHNEQLYTTLFKHLSHIGGIHTGHHHTDSFRIFYNDNGDAVGSILLAPSVTPWESTLPGLIGGGSNNPSIRLIKYDRDTGLTLDIYQYYLNLTEANLSGSPEWILEYQATDYYQQPNMGSESLSAVAQNFLDDNELFNKYYAANGVNFDPNEVCTGECRFIHYCAITEIQYDRYEECMKALISGCPTLQSSIVLLFGLLTVPYVFKKTVF